MTRISAPILLVFLLLCAAFTTKPVRKSPSNFSASADTSIILYSENGRPLKYSQYDKLLETGRYNVMFKDGKFFLNETPSFLLGKTPMDSKSIAARKAAIMATVNGHFVKKSLAGLDTTILVYNDFGTPLRFYQYVKLMRTGKYFIFEDKGRRYLKSSQGLSADSVSVINRIHTSLSLADKVLVEKSKRKLSLERNGKIIFTFPVNLGKSPVGPKRKSGDGRTPEGLYYLDYNVTTNASYYFAYHISYPNAKDIQASKALKVSPGSDVMIHGTSPQKAKLKDWTNGSIAISNSHIDTLRKYVYPNIPIEIRK